MSHHAMSPLLEVVDHPDGEPTPGELDAIEREMSLIQASVELLDVEIALMDQGPSQLGACRLRRARRRVLAARRALARGAATAPAGGAA